MINWHFITNRSKVNFSSFLVTSKQHNLGTEYDTRLYSSSIIKVVDCGVSLHPHRYISGLAETDLQVMHHGIEIAN